MNRSLQARIVLFFSILFMGIQALTFVAVYWVSKENVLGQLGQNLVYAEHIFNRLLIERGEHMAGETRIIAADFGFLAAVNSNDNETVRSAVENLTLRIRGHRGFYINMDNKVIADTAGHLDGSPFLFPYSIRMAEQEGQAVTFGVIDGELFELAVVPVLAPGPSGWVAIAVAVDKNLVEHFKSLSSTSLEISIIEHSGQSSRIRASSLPEAQRQALDERISQDQMPEIQRPELVKLENKVFLTQSMRLPTASNDQWIMAFLQIDLAEALHPYLVLFYAALGLLGLSLIATVFGGVLIARRITRPLRLLSEATQSICAGQFNQLIPFDQRDELGLFAENFNIMTSKLKKTMEELKEVNQTLEKKVEQRTSQYKQANEELTQAMLLIQMAQTQLVQSEKMAALGCLVAGVAHEINTPVGVGVTAASCLNDTARQIVQLYKQGKMKKSDLEDFLETSETTTNMILKNLEKAANLIQSFKQVAVDQSSEAKRRFNIKSYLEETLTSLNPTFKNTAITCVVECLDSIEIDSYPGAISQIVTNLVMNALAHAYNSGQTGQITIRIAVDEKEQLHFTFSDDGKGIPEANIGKIFDPFFTTRRGSGGSGLGLNIVYNLVTQTLKGSITCSSVEGEGTRFILSWPIRC